jgi:hypothetical protein
LKSDTGRPVPRVLGGVYTEKTLREYLFIGKGYDLFKNKYHELLREFFKGS